MKQLELLSKSVAIICGYALLGLSLFTVLEILARKLANYSFQGVDELGGYILAVTASFGFAHALLQRAHTRIDLLLVRVGLKPRAALNVVAAVATASFATFMAWRGYHTLKETLAFDSRANTPWETPLWIPQSLWFAGLCMFAAVATILVFRSVWLLFADPVRQDEEVGVPRLAEEIDKAIEGQSRVERGLS